MKIDNKMPHHHSFAQQNNSLSVAGLSIDDIAQLLGSTPFYVYDKKQIIDRVTSLKALLPQQVKLHYAIKANPLPSLVHMISQHVSGFDVASNKEMLLALQTNISATDISFAGPGKTPQDLRSAIIANVTLHVESASEISKIETIAASLRRTANIAIRINPKFELKASGMKMSGGAKPFGIDEEQVESVLKNINKNYIKLCGFHIYSGSQNLNADAIIECHQQTLSLANNLITLAYENNHQPLAYINIGGGLGVPYFNHESPLDVEKVCQHLSSLLAQYSSALSGIDIVMELGRYLVAEAGLYVTKVIDKKISRGTQYLVCDGGLHHHLANSGNFGQVIRKNYPVMLEQCKSSKTDQEETVTVVGPLCTPLDVLADNVTLTKASQGDYFIVFQSGAYGASASPNNFLSQPALQEILL
ncbi:pyridoxal-dependent decarboxylase, exosortase A system-associated [Litorilituus lipolyticus]|uniref:Pyridoxal-dependent decarboxylase, exosortase A system-associated n=1 Tax=Litorilituus lipolyticus TaxID=2491017 RepID=A0A502LCA3_9GAMM|nr:pyridoxal-dependent decarboxylase, exosortase A system-associated [Litorilituus lipolyticus]TPH17767.1 pyridoxal-dependent decarboxylase, exosortase A system-associated [Litorilituus lipolyticus]